MAIPDKRILTRNVRLALADVYGKNPFDATRQINAPLESVLGGLKDVRKSLGKVKTLADSLKALKGLGDKFKPDDLKAQLLDALGVNLFKRNIADIKSELNTIAGMLGFRTRSSIDRLNGMSAYSKYTTQNHVQAVL